MNVQPTRKANIRGKIVGYDVCSERRFAYKLKVFRCVGRGTIHSIGRTKQQLDQEYWFFVYRPKYIRPRAVNNLSMLLD